MRAWRALIVLAAALASAEQQPGQESELAAAARREAQRRQAVERRKPPRSYGDEDLKRPGATASPAPGGGTESQAASYTPQVNPDFLGESQPARPGSEGPPPVDDTRAQDEAYRQQADAARERLARARGELASNQQRQDAARIRLNPMSPSYEIDTNGQLQLQAELTQLQLQEAELREAVDAAEAGWRALEEEARRNGVKLSDPGRRK